MVKLNKEELDKIKRKLTKLLALSSSTNAAEAALAMEKCQELMQKYNIRTVDVDEVNRTADVKDSAVEGYTDKHEQWESKLGAIIASCLDGVAVINLHPRNNAKWQLIFVAGTSEQEIIVDLFKRLRRSISIMAREYSTRKRERDAYITGMSVTIHERLKKIYAQNIEVECRDLVIIKKDAVQNRLKEMFGQLQRHKYRQTQIDRTAYLRGIQDGHKVRLGRSVQHQQHSRLT